MANVAYHNRYKGQNLFERHFVFSSSHDHHQEAHAAPAATVHNEVYNVADPKYVPLSTRFSKWFMKGVNAAIMPPVRQIEDTARTLIHNLIYKPIIQPIQETHKVISNSPVSIYRGFTHTIDYTKQLFTVKGETGVGRLAHFLLKPITIPWTIGRSLVSTGLKGVSGTLHLVDGAKNWIVERAEGLTTAFAHRTSQRVTTGITGLVDWVADGIDGVSGWVSPSIAGGHADHHHDHGGGHH